MRTNQKSKIQNRKFAAAAILLSAASAMAQPYEISWYTVDGGGGANSTGGTFSVAGTIAQPDASSFTTPMTGGSFTVVGGFWSIATPTCALPGDMDLNALRNGRDVQDFVDCILGTGSNCTCADTSGNGTVGLEDVAGFV